MVHKYCIQVYQVVHTSTRLFINENNQNYNIEFEMYEINDKIEAR
jgi:hypothetical protein